MKCVCQCHGDYDQEADLCLHCGRTPFSKTLSLSVPPKQAIKAGWVLLTRGIWYWLTRKDIWISSSFHDR